MTDPFAVLHGGDVPVTPRPEFARNLKQQLEQRLLEETTMTSMDQNETIQAVSNLFYFTLPAPDLERSKQFYSRIFGWNVGGGSLGGHIPNVTPSGGLSPGAGTNDRTVYLTVDDIEQAASRVRQLGGVIEGDLTSYETGKMIQCRDDQGTTFCLQEPAPGEYADYANNPAKAADHGDLYYFSLPVADGARGRSFYSALLGWEFGEQGNEGGMHAENMITDGGIGAGREGDRVEFWFRVDDMAAAIEEIRAAGGSADEPMDTPQGPVSGCTDDQGVPFGIIQPVG